MFMDALYGYSIVRLVGGRRGCVYVLNVYIISRSWRVLEDQEIGKILRIFKSPL